MNDDIKKYEQEIREILLKEFKNHILFIGEELIESDIFSCPAEHRGAKKFWEKLQLLCL